MYVPGRSLKGGKNIKKRKFSSCNVTKTRAFKPEISIINSYENKTAQYELRCNTSHGWQLSCFETVGKTIPLDEVPPFTPYRYFYILINLLYLN